MVGTLKLMDEITDHYDVVMYDVDNIMLCLEEPGKSYTKFM